MWRIQRCINSLACKRNLHTNNLKRNSDFVITEEVMYALGNKAPIVALESTIITHGMPFPENIKCALDVEKEVRRQGAIPATIAILGGKVHVGLNHDQIAFLADTNTNKSIKTSRRDFPYVLSQKLNGGTTVSGTIIVAGKVGIPVFVTGGIGGVHRQGENTLDISADLTELGRNSVAVVSGGVKSILDIPRTLEYLETQGVFVATFGETTDFPAFYSRKSGAHAPYNVNSARQAAEVIRASLELGSKSGLLFAVPIPKEDALEEGPLQEAIEQALKEAEKQGISGKNITPFLLSAVNKMTQGRSLQSNIALIKNNAKIGGQIAVELSGYLNQGKVEDGGTSCTSSRTISPVVIGGSVLDCCAKIEDPEIKLDGSIHYTKFTLSAGGVGRNICEALQKLGAKPSFLSVVGNDGHGMYLRSLLEPSCTKSVEVLPGVTSAQCTVVLDSKGDCKMLLGQMDIHKKITPDMIRSQQELLKRSPLIVADGNLPVETLDCVLEIADKYRKPVFYEPTDVPVAASPFHSKYSKNIKYITPNIIELRSIAKFLNLKASSTYPDVLSEAAELGKLLSQFVENIIVTLGPLGLVMIRRGSADDPLYNFNHQNLDIQVRHYNTTEIKQLVNVSGAGDCFASGLIVAMLAGCPENICVSVGFTAAQMALQTKHTVPSDLFDQTHISWKQKAPYVQL